MRCFALTPTTGRSIASTSCGAAPSLISTMAHPPLTAPGSMPRIFTSHPHQIAADEFAPELVGGVHHHEAAGGRVDDELARLGGGDDQPRNERDRLHVRMDAAIDLLRPARRDCVVAPGRAGSDRRLLQHDEIITAPAAALAH